METSQNAVQHTPEREQNYFGQDCPKGMVQIEFVGCSPKDKYCEYGWKPVESAFLEIYVDGERYRIEVGDFHDGKSEKRGLHIVGPINMQVEQNSVNAASVFQKAKDA